VEVGGLSVIASLPPRPAATRSRLVGRGSSGKEPARGRRLHIQVLDACLERLENANEAGRTYVPPDVSRDFARYVPGLEGGMLISAALALVFDRQALYLQIGPAAGPSAAVPLPVKEKGRGTLALADSRYFDPDAPCEVEATSAPLTKAEALSLTEKVKRNMHQVSVLLLEAHRRQVWKPLSYPSWEQYVRKEFGISRSRSYELLDHGVVVTAVMRTANLTAYPNISAHAAQKIKPQLPLLLETISRRTATLGPEQAQTVIPLIVRDLNRQHQRNGYPADGSAHIDEGGDGRRNGIGLTSLYAAVECLAALDPPADLARRIPAEDWPRFARLLEAMQWLVEFSQIWTNGLHIAPVETADPTFASAS
jgi:hypothetical protein